MTLNQSTYLTQVHLSAKNQERKNNRRESNGAISTFHEQNSKSKFVSSVKFTDSKKTHENKIFTRFMHDNYYETKKVKPGVNILKIIAEGEEQRRQKKKVPQLEINIPETVLFVDNMYQLLYNKEGKVKIESDISFAKWHQILKYQKQNIVFPAALQVMGAIQMDHSIIMSNDLGQKIMPKSETQAIVKYNTPFGLYPNVLRLFYFPTGTRTIKKSYGFKIVNKKKINEDLLSKKHKLIHFFIVDTNREDSYEAILVKGKALESLEKMSQSLVNYIQHLKGVKISQIVLDFTFDTRRIYWLTEVLSVKSTSLHHIWDIGSQDEVTSFTRQLSNYIHCRLCGFVFPKNQVSKKVTNKLIAELVIHMKNRGKHFPIEVNVNTNCLSDFANVCQICFELILAQHRLIDVQHQFCRLINISSNPIERVPLENCHTINEDTRQDMEKSTKKKQLKRDKKLQIFNLIEGIKNKVPAIRKSCMYQWRLFFYIEKIKNVPRSTAESFTLSMKFKDKTETYKDKVDCSWKLSAISSSRAKSALSTQKRSHLKQASFCSVDSAHKREVKKTTFPTHYTNRTQQIHFNGLDHKVSLSLQKIKVLVFYTKEDDIKKILMNQQLAFDLTIGSQHYKGSSATLQVFTNKKSCQRHSCQILLFDEKYKYCNLELTVGLVCDGYTDVQNMQLYDSEDKSVCYPGRILGNCNPLPEEWIEILLTDEMKNNEKFMDLNWKEKI